MTARARRGRDERGATLILALAFVMVFGLAITATLDYADASFKQDNANKSARDAIFGANSATESLINAMRSQISWGRAGVTCNPLTYTLPDGRTATVTCVPESGSGASAGPPIYGPPQLLVTMSTNPYEAGVSVIGTGTVRSPGAILATSLLDVQQAASRLDATGYSVVAGGACDATRVLATPAAICASAGAGAQVTAATAMYTSPINAAPATQSVPACPGGIKPFVALAPGTYTDAAALSALTDGSCPNLVLQLQPGTFLFAFSQSGFAAQWRVSDPTVDVVGGTPKGWTVGPWAGPKPTMPQPGACVAPIDVNATASTGVSLVFSGESQLYVNGAHNVEFCANPWPNASMPRPVIYGLTAAIGLTRAQDQCVALAGGCPFITVVSKADGSASGVLNLQGTLYAPKGNVSIDVRNSTVAKFNMGAVVRSFLVKGLAGGATVTPLSLPAGIGSPGGYTDRFVVLTTTIGGVQYMRVRVQFVDNAGATPGQAVKILEWSAAK